MDAGTRIRDAVNAVSQLRSAAHGDAHLNAAIGEIKRIQSGRFAATYADLFRDRNYEAAARFFLEELYSDKDYAQRDEQFARIAGAIGKFFPAQVGETAVALAELHAVTEDLDHAMGHAWLASAAGDPAARYVDAWRATGRRAERQHQLVSVIRIGHEMTRLTRTPALRVMLRMMRGPAEAAGLSSLQRFLERGFDTFGAMAKRRGAAEAFLDLVEERERALMTLLFDGDHVACETQLAHALGQAR